MIEDGLSFGKTLQVRNDPVNLSGFKTQDNGYEGGIKLRRHRHREGKNDGQSPLGSLTFVKEDQEMTASTKEAKVAFSEIGTWTDDLDGESIDAAGGQLSFRTGSPLQARMRIHQDGTVLVESSLFVGAGGLIAAQNTFVGGGILVEDSSPSTSPDSGAIHGVAKVGVGGTTAITGGLTVSGDITLTHGSYKIFRGGL